MFITTFLCALKNVEATAVKVEYYCLHEVLESMRLHKNCGPIEDYVEMGQQRRLVLL